MPNKKDKTPAVRDRYARKKIEELDATVVNLVDQLEDRIAALEAKLPTTKAEEPKWVPKINDWVVRDFPEAPDHGKIAQVVCVNEDVWSTVTVELEGRQTNWKYSEPRYCRPATEAEIAAHLFSLQYQGIEELQEGDCCEVTPEQQKELLILHELIWPGSDTSGIDHDQVAKMYFRSRNGGFTWAGATCKWDEDDNPIPYKEFRRRALGTIKKRQEEEQKRPIEFGTRVKHKASSREFIVARKVGAGISVLTPDGILTTVDRKDLTIIP